MGLCVAAAALGASAEEEQAKFCNVILHNQETSSIVGLHRFIDGARTRGSLDRIRLTIIMNGREDETMPSEQEFFRGLMNAGHEIAVEWASHRDRTAAWLGIPAEKITTLGAELFADADLESQSKDAQAGFRAVANVCVEGNSLAEFWDIPHNWEGAPMFPYWVQWDDKNPLHTARTNREMDRTNAILELQWASRTLWHNYDRFPIPQCWHFGEPLKQTAWSVGQLVHRKEKGGWWRVELTQYENNLRAGWTPFLYLNTASEGNIFTPKGPWSPMLDNDEALDCALDLVDLMLERGWKLVTVSDFAQWYAKRWPCPAAPSMVYLVDDTLANRRDRDGMTIEGHGRLLHAETKHYQICDHENRLGPEMVIAYDLRTPNLHRNGYTFANPAQWADKASSAGRYASTTGNALFWGPSDSLMPYFPPCKPPACRNRTFTFYLGDQWEPYQFVKSRFLDVERKGDEIRWSKITDAPVAGTDIRLTFHHLLQGENHTIRVTVAGDAADGLPARFQLCPYFHQGWDPPLPTEKSSDLRIPDPQKVGQERNVFAQAAGDEFAFSESNDKLNQATFHLTHGTAGGPLQFSMFNRNPGLPDGAYDDNPAMNRGFTLSIDAPEADVRLVDAAGPNPFVTAIVELGKHVGGREYAFTFSYWHGKKGGL